MSPSHRSSVATGQPTAPTAVEDTMFRALGILRVVVLINSLVLFAWRQGGYARPALGWAVLVFLVVWTGFALWAYDVPRRRTRALLIVDLLIAVIAITLTEAVKGPTFSATLPGFYVMGVVLAWAVHWRWPGGLVASVVICVVDVAIRKDFTQGNYGNIFLLLLGGPIVGFLSGLLQSMAAERDAALRLTATAAERQRLARVVHDGVLQVLGIVQRRGNELGGEAAELGRLAGEQEVALRALVQHEPIPAAQGTRDLAEALALMGTTSVQVSLPGGRAILPAVVADEVAAVVGAALSNVRHHVGRDARAWVLLEDLGDRWAVSVRDEGPGIPAGREEQAAAEGRLGIASSIRGRIAELGGTSRLASSAQGTEWDFEIPK